MVRTHVLRYLCGFGVWSKMTNNDRFCVLIEFVDFYMNLVNMVQIDCLKTKTYKVLFVSFTMRYSIKRVNMLHSVI